jgi:hypothetical protein
LTGNHTVSHHQRTACNRNNPVPCSWQTSGPITLAGDTIHHSVVHHNQVGVTHRWREVSLDRDLDLLQHNDRGRQVLSDQLRRLPDTT